MEHTFTIPLPRPLPSPNHRLHHHARGRITAEIKNVAAIVARSERNRLNVPKAEGRRSVKLDVVRGPGQRMTDPDNAAASTKVILDALVLSGWLRSDDLAGVSLPVVSQVRGPADPWA